MNNDYLMHYGILGMKWGVRRYQNEDGSLTNAGKKRYSNEQRIRDEKIYGKAAARRIEKRINRGEGIQSASERKAGWRKSLQKTESRIYESAKAQIAAENPSLSTEQVEKQASDYIKIGKAAISIAALSLVTYAGIEAYKHGSTYFDGKIAAGKTLQRIERFSDVQLHDQFYASYKAGDNALYRNILGRGGRFSAFGKTPMKMTLEAVSPIKVANHHAAKKIYDELFSASDKYPSYEYFNEKLIDRSKDALKYYDALKSKGYSAIYDYNDQSRNGARAPIIVFDKSAVKVKEISELNLSSKEQKRDYSLIKMQTQVVPSILAKFGDGGTTAGMVAIGAVYAASFGIDAKAGKNAENKKNQMAS